MFGLVRPWTGPTIAFSDHVLSCHLLFSTWSGLAMGWSAMGCTVLVFGLPWFGLDIIWSGHSLPCAGVAIVSSSDGLICSYATLFLALMRPLDVLSMS